jgi:electron transport complex protein RnfE
MTPEFADIWRDGLWRNNAGLVQLLGLCPLLAVSGTVVNAIGLGLATTLTLCVSNLCVSLVRRQVTPEIRISVFVVIIAAAVTSIELLMNAFAHSLYRTLGIFIPLIVTNCLIIGRAEAFASRQAPLRSLVDGLASGLGFTACLITMGVIREIIGRGTLFDNMHLLFGELGRDWSLQILPEGSGLLLAVLPPGAFLILGFMVAGKRWLDMRQVQTRPVAVAAGNAVAEHHT